MRTPPAAEMKGPPPPQNGKYGPNSRDIAPDSHRPVYERDAASWSAAQWKRWAVEQLAGRMPEWQLPQAVENLLTSINPPALASPADA